MNPITSDKHSRHLYVGVPKALNLVIKGIHYKTLYTRYYTKTKDNKRRAK